MPWRIFLAVARKVDCLQVGDAVAAQNRDRAEALARELQLLRAVGPQLRHRSRGDGGSRECASARATQSREREREREIYSTFQEWDACRGEVVTTSAAPAVAVRRSIAGRVVDKQRTAGPPRGSLEEARQLRHGFSRHRDVEQPRRFSYGSCALVPYQSLEP